MELKHIKQALLRDPRELLIVPYGIETEESPLVLYQQPLLIVPYGIETVYTDGYDKADELLIVPYGIETRTTKASFSVAACF